MSSSVPSLGGGTLLSDLETNSLPANGLGNNDDYHVQDILANMNSPSQINPSVQQAHGGNTRMINAPNPNSTYNTVDPGTATAHVIGKAYPTQADFANIMHSPQYGAYQQPQMYMNQQPQLYTNSQQYPALFDMTKGNFYSDILSQIKQPVLVAIIVFIVGLPFMTILIGHYLPYLLRSGGDLTTAGMLVKAFIGGFLFWFIQRVLVPLMVV